METTHTKIHVFEKAGLGIAPFKCVGMTVMKYQACQGAPVQPGGSCDYCGTGIMNAFQIVSSDGKCFKVGCDCVAKTGDAGLRKQVNDIERKRREATRYTKAKTVLVELNELLADGTVRAKLAAIPHSNKYWADKGQTELNSIEWMVANAGDAGRAKTLKRVRAILDGQKSD